jgi:AraC family transcriptional regulator, regulatory protein of adaptative response / DNA-3-methyladenine glycosylase II
MNAPNPLDPDACYEALRTHDTRFDGRFFVGVGSTGIYCRPVCPARTPKRENCAFYPSAAAAERAGFRPCLRCRPELAPGNARVDATGRLAAAAVSRIEDGALSEMGVDELARELGVSDRQLRRVVEAECGVSPVELAQTQRLLLAKRLLTDTDLPITEVALASGFASLRRFNALFAERYRMNPTALRKERGAGGTPGSIACEIGYRPPLDWASLLRYLERHALRGVETVDGSQYRRTARWRGHVGWLTAEPVPDRPRVRVEVSASLAPALTPVLARVKRLFDLDADPAPIAERLGPLAAKRPGLRVPGAWDGYEMTVRAILGQQVSVAAATTLTVRFAAKFGEPVVTPFPDLTRLPPAPERVAGATVEEITALGIVRARAASLLALSKAVAEGDLKLRPGGDVGATMTRLKELPGIGEWTAQVVAMRALAWPDAFPHSDLGFQKALNETSPKRILERAEAWRPWRAYAAMHLWKSLEGIE